MCRHDDIPRDDTATKKRAITRTTVSIDPEKRTAGKRAGQRRTTLARPFTDGSREDPRAPSSGPPSIISSGQVTRDYRSMAALLFSSDVHANSRTGGQQDLAHLHVWRAKPKASNCLCLK